MSNDNKNQNNTNLRVISLHEKKGKQKHVDVWNDERVYLDILPLKKHFLICYYIEHEISLGPMGTKPCRHDLVSVQVRQPRWWDRLLGITEENLIDKGVHKVQRRWEKMKEYTMRFEEIREKYGINPPSDQNPSQ